MSSPILKESGPCDFLTFFNTIFRPEYFAGIEKVRNFASAKRGKSPAERTNTETIASIIQTVQEQYKSIGSVNSDAQRYGHPGGGRDEGDPVLQYFLYRGGGHADEDQRVS